MSAYLLSPIVAFDALGDVSLEGDELAPSLSFSVSSLSTTSTCPSPPSPQPPPQATNDLARRLSFSIAVSLSSLLSQACLFVDAPAAVLVDLALQRPERLRSLLVG